MIVEKEYKYLVTEEEFKEIKSNIIFDKEAIQYNYYYDTESLYFNNNDITIRIRKKEDNAKLQLKFPISKNESIEKIEKEYLYVKDLSNISCEKFYEDVLHERVPECLQGENMLKMGVLITKRSILEVKGKYIICFDENSYLGIKDYEIEIEIINDYNDIDNIRGQLEKLYPCLKTRRSSIGKRSRFFNYMEG